jgi:hypothetical protein
MHVMKWLFTQLFRAWTICWLKIAMHRLSQPGHQQTSRAQPTPDKAMQPEKKPNSWLFWKDSGEETDKAKQPEPWVECPSWIEWPVEETEEPEVGTWVPSPPQPAPPLPWDAAANPGAAA